MTGSLVGTDRHELLGRTSRLMERRGQTGEPGAYLRGLPAASLAGTPSELLDRLGELASAGVRRVMLQHLIHDDLEAVALIGEALVPRAEEL